MRLHAPARWWLRVALLIPAAVAVVALVWWRGPEWNLVLDAFTVVAWWWVVAAIALNLCSVVVRAVAWQVVINQAMPPPHPRFRLVFSAFSVGLFANAVLPGRIGELARVAVLSRKLNGRRGGTWAALLGSVFAHRLFDLLPSVTLILYVLFTAKLPHWAVTSLVIVVVVGIALLAIAMVSARRHHRPLDELGPIRKMVMMARYGLGVLHSPVPAAFAAFCQCLGWLFQLFAVFTAMRAFDIHEGLPAAALVLVLMNLATIFPLWPGNVGLVQAAVALPLLSYGVSKAKGIAFGFGLQAIEASVGVSVGLIFLAREGLSFAMLRRMPPATEAPGGVEQPASETDRARARARVPG
jgi:glycosyltransferase 2 family protein